MRKHPKKAGGAQWSPKTFALGKNEYEEPTMVCCPMPTTTPVFEEKLWRRRTRHGLAVASARVACGKKSLDQTRAGRENRLYLHYRFVMPMQSYKGFRGHVENWRKRVTCLSLPWGQEPEDSPSAEQRQWYPGTARTIFSHRATRLGDCAGKTLVLLSHIKGAAKGRPGTQQS
ncbi:uncharacterized protein LOC143655790 [Tamandua tetradactyla]|uniref:uncharacterized protein LOC143655790 n=1 Tax=Tamandua tetradactyla TaxID=48850 RepID=UPI004053FBE0